MNSNSSNNGPYKHPKRPEQGQVQQSKSKKAHRFVKWVIGLVIAVLAGVPIYLTFNHKSSGSNVTTPTRVKTSASSSAGSKSKKIKIVKESSSSSLASGGSSSSSQAASSSSVASSSSSGLRTYMVQDEGSLSSIATVHRISIDTLARLNNTTNITSIRTGGALKLN